MDRCETSWGTEKIRSSVEASCIRSPLRSSVKRSRRAARPHRASPAPGRRARSRRRPCPASTGGRALEVAGGEVVEQRVAGDGVERLGLGTTDGAAADDDRDLGLEVDLRARRRQRHRRPGGGSALRYLAKIVGLVGRLDAGLRGVRAVVEPDADDLFRVGDRRQGARRARAPARRPLGDLCELGEPVRRRSARGRRARRLGERGGGVDHAGVVQNAGAGIAALAIADQAHLRPIYSLWRVRYGFSYLPVAKRVMGNRVSSTSSRTWISRGGMQCQKAP